MMHRLSVPLACLAGLFALGGCAGEKKELPPGLTAPYPHPRSIVVAPLMNQSPSDKFDTIVVTDILVAELAQVKGLTVLPTNQPLKLLVAKGQTHPRSIEEAKQIAQALGVDGVMVGAVTEYNPYKPLKVGMTLQLYWVRADMKNAADRAEPSNLESETVAAYYSGVGPMAQASAMFDASTNEITKRVQVFARTHEGLDSAFGWRRYLVDSDAYMHFVCHEMIVTILDQELNRITVPAAAQQRVRREDVGRMESESGMRTVTVNKGSQQFVFRYAPGKACDVLEAVAELASRPGSDFDWVDAAGVSFQIASEQAANCLKAIEPSSE